MTVKTKHTARPLPAFGEVWRHFKGGEYTILGIAKPVSEPRSGDTMLAFASHSETRENVLVFGPAPDRRDLSVGLCPPGCGIQRRASLPCG